MARSYLAKYLSLSPISAFEEVPVAPFDMIYSSDAS
jgi:hypothetical protein